MRSNTALFVGYFWILENTSKYTVIRAVELRSSVRSNTVVHAVEHGPPCEVLLGTLVYLVLSSIDYYRLLQANIGYSRYYRLINANRSNYRLLQVTTG